tara:strand:+ start:17 stop:766 length:750 start_codon:yes stop_codon:yes gene_type:complete
MKVKITIPDYLSVANFQKLQNLEHLSDLEKLIETIHVFTGIDREEVAMWSPKDLGKITNDLTSAMEYKEIFYPVFELDGVNYGYSDISQMSLGEFIDLEKLSKEPIKNLHEIMAIIYRPIEKHKFDKMSWKTLHGIRLFTEKLDNIFKWYTLQKYDSKDRESMSLIMAGLPVQFALGALSFFLGIVNIYLNSSLPSLDNQTKAKSMRIAEIMTEETLGALTNIGDGLRHYIHSPKQIYSVSQEKEVSLI